MSSTDNELLAFWDVYVRTQVAHGQRNRAFLMQWGMKRLFEHCFKHSRIRTEHQMHVDTMVRLDAEMRKLSPTSSEFSEYKKRCETQAQIVEHSAVQLRGRYDAVAQHLMTMAPALEMHVLAVLSEDHGPTPATPSAHLAPWVAAPETGPQTTQQTFSVGNRVARLVYINIANAIALAYDKVQGI